MSRIYRQMSFAVGQGLYKDLVQVHQAIMRRDAHVMCHHWMLLRAAAVDNDQHVSEDKTTFLVRLLMMHDLPEDVYRYEVDKAYKALCEELPPAAYRSERIHDYLNWQMSVVREIWMERATRSLSKARLFREIEINYKRSQIYMHARRRACSLSHGIYDITEYEGEDNKEAV